MVLLEIKSPTRKRYQEACTPCTRFVVAVLASWVAEIFTYPLDVVKTRLQIQSESTTSKIGFKLEDKGLFTTSIDIARKEGVIKLWSGLLPTLQRHAVYCGGRLLIYEKFRDIVRDDRGRVTVAWAIIVQEVRKRIKTLKSESLLGGLFSGSVAQFIASPLDIVRVQMQAEGRGLVQGMKPRFANSRECYIRIYRESGITGFWRGSLPNIYRAALVNLGDFVAYDVTKQKLIQHYKMDDSFIVHTIGSLVAGLVAAILGTPADVIKTRLMNQPVGPDGRGKLYRGIIDCLRQSVRNEGLISLYKGFVPNFMRLVPWAILNWLAFENIMKLIGQQTF